MFVVLSLVISICSLAYFLIQKRYNFWNERGFVGPPTSFPFGSIKGFGSTVHVGTGMQKYYNEFKGKAKALGIYIFLSPTLLIVDIELVKNIYIRDFSSFHDRGFYYNKEDDPLSANLVILFAFDERKEFRNFIFTFTAHARGPRVARQTSETQLGLHIRQNENDVRDGRRDRRQVCGRD